jgi:hypothetical protein
MDTISKLSAKKNSGLQDDHDPSDIGQRTANKPKQQSQMEGPVAYAPHDEGEKKGQKPTDATKQRPDTPADADSLGGGRQGGM